MRDFTNTWVLMFPEHKIAYIPVPKAANSSIRAELLRLLDIAPEDVPKVQGFDGFDKRRFDNCPELFDDDWYVFSAVRNPFSRAASAYLDKVVTRHEVLGGLSKMGINRNHSFHDFLKHISAWPQTGLNNHIMPSSLLLRRAFQLPNFKVYKIEDLDTAWEAISKVMTQRTGIKFGSMGRRNVSKAKIPWRSLYDAKTEAMVRSIYKGDFERFSYPDQLEAA